jgi:hypothetical protein
MSRPTALSAAVSASSGPMRAGPGLAVDDEGYLGRLVAAGMPVLQLDRAAGLQIRGIEQVEQLGGGDFRTVAVGVLLDAAGEVDL